MSDRKYQMNCSQPAVRWNDAFPSGNGTIGALVYGNIQHETILLNHEDLWARTEKPVVPSISEHLAELRALLEKGHYQQAERFIISKLEEKGEPCGRIDPFLPAFAIQIETDVKAPFEEYRRSIDFETAEVSVSWKEAGIAFERKLFVSRSDDAVVMAIRSSECEKVNCSFALTAHAESYKDKELNNFHRKIDTKADNNWLRLHGTNCTGIGFGGIARIETKGGVIENNQEKVLIKNADEVFVLIKAFVQGNPIESISHLESELQNQNCNYDVLLERHAACHGKLFSRMTLDLNCAEKRNLPNEVLLAEAYLGSAPTALLERMFDYGRYLLVCSSRPNGLPANLQGVWNGSYEPDWNSDFHNDENIQMNYWQALPGNLAEATHPYFEYYESMIPDYRENAQKIYGCRGILAPIAQSTHGTIYYNKQWPAPWPAWTAGAGWLAQLFYDYYLFTQDKEFLKNRALPFLKEVALFYEDFLFEDKNGKLVFSPSLSPENVPERQDASMLTINATMDIAIAKEVFSNLCNCCEILDIEHENVCHWRKMIEKLPEYRINEDGALAEWLHPEFPDNYSHRHLSHLYPLFPGFEITKENNKELFEGIYLALEKRLAIGLNSQTGWSLAHAANIYARLSEGDKALYSLNLLTRSCVGPNLFTHHNDWRRQGITLYWAELGDAAPFQIDANLGLTAAVLEMLVFSAPGMLKLLPALPSNWRKGNAQRMLCRGGLEVSLNWDMDAKTLEASILPQSSQKLTLSFPETPKTLNINTSNSDITESDLGPNYKSLALVGGRKTNLSISF